MAQNAKLVISDLQIPFEAEKALSFCLYIKRHFKIADDDVYNVGDETDQFWGGVYPKSPEVAHTPNSELTAAKEKLKEWYKAFPKMKLAISNHGTRWIRKASQAEIPSQLLRAYEEVIDAPKGWKWQKRWLVPGKMPFYVEHGDDWGGQFPHVQAAMHMGHSIVIGHHHTKAGVEHIRTSGLKIWGAVASSLIDFEQYAFEYAQRGKLKPSSGLIVVLDHGRMPIYCPYD